MQVLYKVQCGLTDPGDQGLPALDVTKVLRESGPPDAESRAGRRHEVLGGLMNNTWSWESQEEIDPDQAGTNIAENVVYLGRISGAPKELLGS